MTRDFLFLQGPPGPFFAELATGLRAVGHRCHRVHFTGGDQFDWPGAATHFTGTLGGWPAHIHGLLVADGITDVVLFGDCRPLHAAARGVAGALAITVHVFEEGYIRPDWVTLERGGVNGHSSLPRGADAYRRHATLLPPVVDHPPVPASFRTRAAEALAYFVATRLRASRFPGYRSHRPHGPAAELAGWIRRMALRPLARLRSAASHRALTGRRYVIVPLQLDSDHQIRTHSPFAGMTEAIETIVESFARSAPADLSLMIKEHPLDNGLRPWRRTIRAIATRHAVPDRIRFVEHGDLHALVIAATGLVTVNSTTGTFALAAGTPVAVLGHAVYDLPGLTHRQGLDAFWTAPVAPDPALYDAFRRVLAARCLLRGGFSSRAGRALLIPGAIDRLLASPTPTAIDEAIHARSIEVFA